MSPLEADFLDLMPHIVTIQPWLSEDFHGGDSYGDPVRYIARVVGKGIALRRREGEEDTVIYDIYIGALENGEPVPETTVFTTRDKITLPADQGLQDETPLIFSIGRFPDEKGQHHTKIQCGFMYHRQGQ